MTIDKDRPMRDLHAGVRVPCAAPRRIHFAAWLADGAAISPAAPARPNTWPIITTAGPETAVAARRAGNSAIVPAITVSSGRVALMTATAGVALSSPAAIAACAKAAWVFTGM